jgi:hypothetical protein
LEVIVPIYLIATLFAWSFGVGGSPRAIAILATVGLVLTVLGVVALCLAILWMGSSPRPTHGLNLLAGLFYLILLLPGALIELSGVVLTIAICMIGVRRAARPPESRFTLLLIGALVPISAVTLAVLFPYTLSDLFGSLPYIVVHVYLPVLLPIVSGIFSTLYAVRVAAAKRAVGGKLPM